MRMAEYLEWLLTPTAERDPQTKTELAERLQVTPATLRNYDRDPWLQRELVARGRALNRVERAGDVLEALYKRALGDGAPANQAAKIWLDWVDKRTEGGPSYDLSEMTDQELKALLEEMLIETATDNEA